MTKTQLFLDTNKLSAIIISGKIASGKDYLANTLQEEYSNLVKVSFADALKEEVTNVMNYLSYYETVPFAKSHFKVTNKNIQVMNRYLIEFMQSKPNNFSAYAKTPETRKMLQYWGTSVRRKQDPDYWVKKMLTKIEEENKKGNIVVIPDARFPNEMAIQEILPIVSIRINISKELQKSRVKNRDGINLTKSMLEHESENALNDYDKFSITISAEDNYEDNLLKIKDLLSESLEYTAVTVVPPENVVD